MDLGQRLEGLQEGESWSLVQGAREEGSCPAVSLAPRFPALLPAEGPPAPRYLSTAQAVASWLTDEE